MGKRTTDDAGKTIITNKRGNGEGTEPKYNEKRKVWEVQVTLGRNDKGKLHRPVISAPTRTECREKRDAALAAYRGGAFVKSSKDTFGNYLRQWLEAKKVGLQPGSLSALKYAAKHLVELEKIPLQKLSRQMVQNVISQKSQKLRPKYIRDVYRIIKNVCELAITDKKILESPCKKIVVPKVSEIKINILSEEEMIEIMKALFGTRLYDVVFLELRTGFRRGEILGLSWDCVNFQTGEITINKSWIMVNDKPSWSQTATGTKTEAGERTIPVPEDALLELQQIRTERPNDVYVFQARNGLPMRPDNFRKKFKEKCREIGLDETRFHDLRHNYGTTLAAAGIHQKLIEAMLGHKDYRSSRRYIHATKKTQQDAALAIGEAMQNVKAFGCKPVANKEKKPRKPKPPKP